MYLVSIFKFIRNDRQISKNILIAVYHCLLAENVLNHIMVSKQNRKLAIVMYWNGQQVRISQ